MICFQSIIFDILKTTLATGRTPKFRLWFAFNLLSLTYWKQRKVSWLRSLPGCDLLSIYYLWHTENNVLALIDIPSTVVICFQSIIFDILKTTKEHREIPETVLWFAFNLLSLTYWKQREFKQEPQLIVVICFQSIIFDILKTTYIL